jgi:hypothetical protein
MDEYPCIPVDGFYGRSDDGGVLFRFTRRTFEGISQLKDNNGEIVPGAARVMERTKIVCEIWMSKEMAFKLRGTLNDLLSKKAPELPKPKKEMDPATR